MQMEAYRQMDIITDISVAYMADSNLQLASPYFWFAQEGSFAHDSLPFSVISNCTIAGGRKTCSPKTG
jgi:hypothetical protein